MFILSVTKSGFFRGRKVETFGEFFMESLAKTAAQ